MSSDYNENDFHFHYNHRALMGQSLFQEKYFSHEALCGGSAARGLLYLNFYKLDNN
jgi:hypothetical protein